MPEKPKDFIVTQISPNFVYPEVKPEDYKFGSGQLEGTPLRADGDWRDYLPPEEDQNIRGIESSACYVEASQHAIATIEEEGLEEPDNNYSARFNALLSGGTQQGGNPLKGGESMREHGLVPDSLMPFGDAIQSWADFHSFKGVAEEVVRAKGKEYLGKKILGYDIVCERWESVEAKYKKLKQSLQFSPCPVSVTAWYEKDGIYYKPEGMNDNHLVELVYIDIENHPYIRDTYAPYLKKLEANFNFDFAMRWSVDKRAVPSQPIPPPAPQTQENILTQIIALLKKILAIYSTTPPSVPVPPVLSNRERLHNSAKSFLGKDARPLKLAPKDFGCAEAVCTVVNSVDPTFPRNITYTPNLKSFLDKNTKYKQTKLYSPGCIIISPTGMGNGKITGHTGIMGEKDVIYSNNSLTGLWDDYYTLTSWIARYRTKGALPIFFYEPVALVGATSPTTLPTNKSKMQFSTTIVAVIVNLLSMLLPLINVQVGTDDLTNSIQTIVAVFTGAYIWWQRTRLQAAPNGVGDVNLAGIKQ